MKTTGVDWSYYDKFEKVNDMYLPTRGQGETMATQIVTVINKLIYKWYNDGDVFDNTYILDGWCNDLSSFANWLYNHYESAKPILDKIEDSFSVDYEILLKELADTFLNEELLEIENQKKSDGSIYNEIGKFRFEDIYDEDEDDCYYWTDEDEDDY